MPRPTHPAIPYTPELLAERQKFIDNGYYFALLNILYHRNINDTAECPSPVRVKPPPPALISEILEMIVEIIKTTTSVSDVLKNRQMKMPVVLVHDLELQQENAVTGVLRTPFPSYDDKHTGYYAIQGHTQFEPTENDEVLTLKFKSASGAPDGGLKWTVTIDLRKIVVSQTTKTFPIPETAITIQTNARELQTQLKLSDKMVNELLAFRLHGTMAYHGCQIILSQFLPGESEHKKKRKFGLAELGLIMYTKIMYKNLRFLTSYSNFTVGDRVMITESYKPYAFAKKMYGKIKSIIRSKHLTFIVEMGDVDSDISKRITQVHRTKKRPLQPHQPAHCLACKISHILKV
jgi:hypothetical protein